MVTISTVIPTIGRETLYTRAIPSVLAQTFTDWECIVVGDGVELEPVDDPRFRFVSVPRVEWPDVEQRWHRGGTNAWDYGLSLAVGAWRSYLGDDDAYRPQHHEWLLGRSRGSNFVYGLSRVKEQDGSDANRLFGVREPDPFDIVQGSYIAARELDISSGHYDRGQEGAWDAQMLARILPDALISHVGDIVHDYYPAPENRYWHRLP